MPFKPPKTPNRWISPANVAAYWWFALKLPPLELSEMGNEGRLEWKAQTAYFLKCPKPKKRLKSEADLRGWGNGGSPVNRLQTPPQQKKRKEAASSVPASGDVDSRPRPRRAALFSCSLNFSACVAVVNSGSRRSAASATSSPDTK